VAAAAASAISAAFISLTNLQVKDVWMTRTTAIFVFLDPQKEKAV
jgi:hypothetical protein